MRISWPFSMVVALLGVGVLASWSHAPRLAASTTTATTAVSATPAASVPAPAASAEATDDALSPRALLGQKLFFDERFSEPPGTSCATCHEPEHAYSGLNGSARGVPRGSRAGHFARRSAPSLLYLRFVPRFHLEWEDEAELPEAFGGFFWDGRVSSLAELVKQPLLNPDEMGNPSLEVVADKLKRAPYAAALVAEFEHPFATTESSLEALGLSLEAFLISRALSPFSSRYDDYVRGQGKLSELELYGLRLFKGPEKGDCGACHRLDDASGEPERSLFTDFGYDTVSAPRNTRLELAPGRYDLGLCEHKDPLRHTEDPWFCGAFRTPSLRNVALRRSFFHSGSFQTLREAVRFYVTPRERYDDLPEKYWQYVNTTTPPYNHGPGDAPALDDAEIDAVVAFLGTLTDRQLLPRP